MVHVHYFNIYLSWLISRHVFINLDTLPNAKAITRLRNVVGILSDTLKYTQGYIVQGEEIAQLIKCWKVFIVCLLFNLPPGSESHSAILFRLRSFSSERWLSCWWETKRKNRNVWMNHFDMKILHHYQKFLKMLNWESKKKRPSSCLSNQSKLHWWRRAPQTGQGAASP